MPELLPDMTIEPLKQESIKIPQKSKSTIARLWPIAALAAMGAFIYFMGWHQYLSFEHLAANREAITDTVQTHFVLSLLTYFVVYGIVVALSLPVGTFMTILGGFLFGPLLGGTATVLSATAGAFLIFMIAKTAIGDTLAARAGPMLEKLRDGFKDHALNYLLFLRLVPLFPFWLVNIAPALLGVRTSTYLLGTFIGIIPATYAFSYVGAGLGSIIDAQQAAYDKCLATAGTKGAGDCQLSFDPGNLVTPEIILAIAGLGLVALLPVVLTKLRKS